MTSAQFLNILIALLVITDPLIALPVVLKVMRNQTGKKRLRNSLLAAFASAMILILMTWFGDSALQVLGIKLFAFQIAGGTIVFLLGLSLLQAKLSSIKANESEDEDSGLFVPLAFPIIAGPGAMSTVIVSAAQFSSLTDHILLTIICLIIAAIAGVLMYFSGYLEKVLGVTGINIFNRVGGLILMAVAIQVIVNGVIGAFPTLQM